MTAFAGALTGKTVVVTRAAHQSAGLIAALEAHGARVVAVPTIATEPVAGAEAAALVGAAAAADRYEWVVLTSTNGVDALAEALPEGVHPARVAVVGRATARAALHRRWLVGLVPTRHTGADLVAEFPAPSGVEPATSTHRSADSTGAASTGAASTRADSTRADAGHGRVLVAQADRAAPTVVEGLRAAGWEVDVVVAYRTVNPTIAPDLATAAARADAITFTSGSTVAGYVATGAAVPPVVVTIGPVTTEAARAAGIVVTAQAAEATVASLTDTLVGLFGSPNSR